MAEQKDDATNESVHAPELSVHAAKVKRAYVAPALRHLGSVREMTNGHPSKGLP